MSDKPYVLALVLAAALQTSVAAQGAWQVSAPAPEGFDRVRAQRDAREHLERLIAIDTHNPPGNELVAARYLDSVLRGIPGIETHIHELAGGRANFIARVRAARPTKRPVLIMGHMDVVGADPAKWTTPPFQASEREGYLYGRGAIDDKGMLAASVAALLQLAARRDTLARDVIFLGTADEENGGSGIVQLLEQRVDLLGDVEFALNEGGRVFLEDGRVRAINIQVTEKVSYNLSVVAKGPSGHGSVPLPANALAALSRALARVHEWRAPVRLNEVTREYFRRLSNVESDPQLKKAMQAIADARDEKETAEAAEILAREPLHNAVLRTGVSLTMMAAGIRANIIPSEATATLNVREMPDGDIRETLAALNRIAAEPNVAIVLPTAVKTSPPISPVSSDLFKVMEAAGRAMAPGATIIPFMSTGGTDGSHLRARGIPTYGILPFPMPREDELRMHGDNERIPIPALGWGTEYLFRVLTAVS